MRLAAALAASIAIVLAAGTASAGAAGGRCGDVESRYLTAVDLKLRGGLDCGIAQTVIKVYFRRVVESGDDEAGQCVRKRFKPSGCRVGDFRCHAREAQDGLHVRCGDGGLRVKFRELGSPPD